MNADTQPRYPATNGAPDFGCPACGGMGRVPKFGRRQDGSPVWTRITCGLCRGVGRLNGIGRRKS